TAKRQIITASAGPSSHSSVPAGEQSVAAPGVVPGGYAEWIPAVGDLTNSPGTELKYRLPTTREVFWTVGLMFTASVLWNLTAIGTLVAVISRQASLSRPEWGSLICAVVLLLIGVGMAWWTWRLYLRWLGRGATIVEVSTLPLRPGESGELYLSQNGQMTETSLEIHLICEETAIFGHGPNTRRETVRVWQEPIYMGKSLTITPESPLEVHAPLSIPPGAMHSFQAAHNRILWQLLIRISTGASSHSGTDVSQESSDVSRPGSETTFERRFPLLVIPEKSDTTRWSV
ncbi:MAG: hypothetical protein Q4C47_04875, partial [Planctomycetia bacterium]|nr:hypothetical protein [Planctomycetia bacterium]